jgi:hypothetical protein
MSTGEDAVECVMRPKLTVSRTGVNSEGRARLSLWPVVGGLANPKGIWGGTVGHAGRLPLLR